MFILKILFAPLPLINRDVSVGLEKVLRFMG